MTEETPVYDAGSAAVEAVVPEAAAVPVAEDLTALRAHLVATHGDAVGELIGGGTVAEMLASVESARAAYQRVAERVGSSVAAAPVVPAGGAVAVIDPDSVPTIEKIKLGLKQRG